MKLDEPVFVPFIIKCPDFVLTSFKAYFVTDIRSELCFSLGPICSEYLPSSFHLKTVFTFDCCGMFVYTVKMDLCQGTI